MSLHQSECGPADISEARRNLTLAQAAWYSGPHFAGRIGGEWACRRRTPSTAVPSAPKGGAMRTNTPGRLPHFTIALLAGAVCCVAPLVVAEEQHREVAE